MHRALKVLVGILAATLAIAAVIWLGNTLAGDDGPDRAPAPSTPYEDAARWEVPRDLREPASTFFETFMAWRYGAKPVDDIQNIHPVMHEALRATRPMQGVPHLKKRTVRAVSLRGDTPTGDTITVLATLTDGTNTYPMTATFERTRTSWHATEIKEME